MNYSTCHCMEVFVMSRGHFSVPFRGLYLPNAWSHTLQTSKRHTSRVSAVHRYHWFGVKLFSVGCAQESRRVPKNAKKCCCFYISGSAHAKNSRIFHDNTRPHLHSDGLPPKSRRSVVSIIGLRVRYKYYENMVVCGVFGCRETSRLRRCATCTRRNSTCAK